MSEIQVVAETTRTILVEVDGGRTLVVEGTPHYELELAVPGVQGPAGPQGPPGQTGPPGPSGAVREEAFAFATPSPIWEAVHDFAARPAVYTYDLNGEPVTGDPSYPAPDLVRVTWAWPMAGSMVLTT